MIYAYNDYTIDSWMRLTGDELEPVANLQVAIAIDRRFDYYSVCVGVSSRRSL
jgi:hypothetical protein